MRWLTYNKASAQNSLPNPALDTILCTFSSNVQFMRSSTPFYCGVSLTMSREVEYYLRLSTTSWIDPISTRHHCPIQVTLFFDRLSSIIFLQLKNTSKTSCLRALGTPKLFTSSHPQIIQTNLNLPMKLSSLVPKCPKHNPESPVL